jgi:hypothetical protein
VLPVIEAKRAKIVTSDFAFDDSVKLIPTPGHTIDHFSVLIGRSRANALVTGDMIHSPLQGKYPELGMMSDYDSVQAGATRRAIFDRFCDEPTIMCVTPVSKSLDVTRATLDGRLSICPGPRLSSETFLFVVSRPQRSLFHGSEPKRHEGVGASSRQQFGVNAMFKTAMFKTALAMSIVIGGAIVIYETFHQDSWWYGSSLAMAWGATVSWARNLI